MGSSIESRIAETVEQLKREGLGLQHRNILRKRSKRLWVSGYTSSQSSWRHDVARDAFAKVQDKSAHLCFVLILLISMTECGQVAFCERNISPLLKLKNYDPYHFSLSARDKSFIEDLAKEQGYRESVKFIALMQALFPDAGDRTFTYAYSRMPKSNIPLFLRILAEAMETSNLCLGETQRGDKETSAVTVLIPAGDVDCAKIYEQESVP